MRLQEEQGGIPLSSTDFNKFGEQIKNSVDSALESGDFKDLSASISKIMNEAIDQVKESIPDYLDEGQKKAREWTAQQTNRLQEQYKQSEARRAEEQRRLQEQYKQQAARNQARNRKSWETSYDRRRAKSGSQASGGDISGSYDTGSRKEDLFPNRKFFADKISKLTPILMTGLGGVFAFDFFISGLGALAFGSFAGAAMALGVSAACGFVCGKGIQQLGRIARFGKYRSIAERQDNIPVKTLAKKVNRSLKQTVKDLEYMIEKNWFYEGHLDEDEGYFLLSDQAYREYVNNKTDCIAKRTEVEQKAEAEKLDDEVTKLIREGEAYVTHIRTCNDQIPNADLTAKLDHMEMLVKRIFDEIKAHPEVSSDMGRMMSYYLPTTAKLLDAYRDLDHQPIQGDNIATTKKEIEDSIDMLNAAFEKFLDGLFADRAMDISTDISVLNTLLAQEGLKEDDFNLQNYN